MCRLYLFSVYLLYLTRGETEWWLISKINISYHILSALSWLTPITLKSTRPWNSPLFDCHLLVPIQDTLPSLRTVTKSQRAEESVYRLSVYCAFDADYLANSPEGWSDNKCLFPGTVDFVTGTQISVIYAFRLPCTGFTQTILLLISAPIPKLYIKLFYNQYCYCYFSSLIAMNKL